MSEPDVALAESLLNPAVLDLVTIQVLHPERKGAPWHGKRRRRNLSRSGTTRDPLERKRGQDRADIPVRIRVIQMVMRVTTIEQHRLLDQAEPQNVRDEV